MPARHAVFLRLSEGRDHALLCRLGASASSTHRTSASAISSDVPPRHSGAARLGGARRPRRHGRSHVCGDGAGRALDDRLGAALPDGGLTGFIRSLQATSPRRSDRSASMLEYAPDYDRLVAQFRWHVPQAYNIGVDVCDRWAAQQPSNARHPRSGRRRQRHAASPTQPCATHSNRLANALRERGIARGDRVAILLPQGVAVPIAHVAIYKLGAIARAAGGALRRRCHHLSPARCRREGARHQCRGRRASSARSRSRCRPRQSCCRRMAQRPRRGSWGGAGGGERRDFAPVDTSADDPAMMIYTSGHHRAAERRAPCPPGSARASAGRADAARVPAAAGDRLWTPADWAWAGGLLNVLLPGLHFGVPVVARKFEKFDPEEAFRLMAEHGDPQHLHAADGAAHAAHRRQSARPLRSRAAHDRLAAAKRLARRPLPGGARRSGSPSTSSTVRPSAISFSPPARRSASAKAGAIGKPVPGHEVGDRPRRTARVCEPERARTDRRHAAGPGDVPVLLEQARGDARRSSSATG